MIATGLRLLIPHRRRRTALFTAALAFTGMAVVKLPFDFVAREPQQCRAQKNVFASRQFRVKARPHLQQAPHPTVNVNLALRRLGDP